MQAIGDFLGINIILDASEDLAQIGRYDDAEAQDLLDAYRQCAEYIAAESGVHIHITEASYDVPHAIHLPKEGECGFALWQDIHACVFDGDGWRFCVNKADAVAKSLKREAADGIAAILAKRIDAEISDLIETEMEDAPDVLTDAVAGAVAEKFGR